MMTTLLHSPARGSGFTLTDFFSFINAGAAKIQ